MIGGIVIGGTKIAVGVVDESGVYPHKTSAPLMFREASITPCRAGDGHASRLRGTGRDQTAQDWDRLPRPTRQRDQHRQRTPR